MGWALFWFSKDAKYHYKMAGVQVEQFIKMGDGICAAEGLAHLSNARGSVICIYEFEQEWKDKLLVQLPGAPRTYFADSDRSIVLIAGKRLVRVWLTGKVDVLHKSIVGFGCSDSIAIDVNGNIYVGAGATIVQLAPNHFGYEERWLIRCQDFDSCQRGE